MEEKEEEDIFLRPEIGEEGPPFSLPLIFSSVRKKGLSGTLKDSSLAPHVHLLLLLLITMGMALVGQLLLRF